MHFICTNLLRHTICALYLCKVCSAQRIRIVDFSAHVALFVCVSYSATSRLCLERWPSPAWERWASSAPAPWTGGSLKPSDLLLLGIIRTRSSGRRHFEGTLKPSDHQLFLGSSRTSKVSLRLCDGSGGVWQKKSVSRSSAFCFQTCKVLAGPKMFQRWYILTAHE